MLENEFLSDNLAPLFKRTKILKCIPNYLTNLAHVGYSAKSALPDDKGPIRFHAEQLKKDLGEFDNSS
jgi:hypothetical protein